ncbi:MAG: hypothetical protein LBU51_08230, partial [Bacteroidales bacterium]|nr:hypothetical protein [Bacteroidales bacterium]
MTKKRLLWAIAFLVTLMAVVYQRMTGPTNPQKAVVTLNEQDYKFKFPRSATTDNMLITFLENAPVTQGDTLYFRNHNTHDNFTAIPFREMNDHKLCVDLPPKAALDKIDYYVTINGQSYFAQEPLVLRYKDPVPAVWLILHIVLMFFSMLFAAYGLITAIFDRPAGKKILNYLYLTTLTLIAGGFILG